MVNNNNNNNVDLQIECQRMWNKKVEVIPVIIGATGIVDKNIQSYLKKIPGKHNTYNLQRSAIQNSTHPKKGTIHQGRLSNHTEQPTM